MMKDLTTSAVARSNVLNNRYALSKLEEHLALSGLRIESELKQNGYRVLKGKSIKNMKLAQVGDTHVVDLMPARLC